ncbi:MmgE/PrpD family protein [Chloroflexota bacterium]
MMNNTDKYSSTLAEYISSLRYDDLPDSVIQQAKKIILDSLGCQLACAQLENGQLIIKFGQSLESQAEASVVGGGYKTSAINAALVNGTLGHGDEIDESLENAGHTAAVTVATALACGEMQSASGKDMITAVVAGYDMAGRLANAGISIENLPTWMTMGSFAGTFWGVATACNILKLTLEQTRISFGLAACQAGGYFDVGSEAKHMAKSLTCGISARNAVTASLLARMGYDGPQSVFDGTQNVLNANGTEINYEELVKNLGKKFAIMDTCIKLYAAGHPIHSPVYGLLKIIASQGIHAKDIDSIVVRLNKREKQTVDDRDMLNINIQYCLALAAFDRMLTWAQFKPERVRDPQVLALKKRVVLVHDPILDERRKITKAHSSEIDVKTKAGHIFSERVDYPPGDPKNPASWEDVVNKVVLYTSRVQGKGGIKGLVDTVENLETVSDVNQLGNLLRISIPRVKIK